MIILKTTRIRNETESCGNKINCVGNETELCGNEINYVGNETELCGNKINYVGNEINFIVCDRLWCTKMITPKDS
ncbi:hypothetical protein Nos7524_4076 [Nostoc sp. PCC 7524]|uniref:hypothetical protein n=1 Tax=Nostoc sp. (strain ATCC 29411 / PCC 7524) TaxID=28072 RepID=UPI00029F39DC|nr:hypothetical protein [Nostoc sp. PCC 7524]AFY49847.1 hypothetical protein Nos7524_4076 [Nostoc sp. PCC 7524]